MVLYAFWRQMSRLFQRKIEKKVTSFFVAIDNGRSVQNPHIVLGDVTCYNNTTMKPASEESSYVRDHRYLEDEL